MISRGVADEVGLVDYWDQYRQLVDMYKYYVDLGVKGAAADYAISGGLLAIVLNNRDNQTITLALWIPIAMNIALAGFLFYMVPKIRELSESISWIATDRLALRQRAHAEVLTAMVIGLLVLAILATIALFVTLSWI